jgi:hypothetical protein
VPGELVKKYRTLMERLFHKIRPIVFVNWHLSKLVFYPLIEMGQRGTFQLTVIFQRDGFWFLEENIPGL